MVDTLASVREDIGLQKLNEHEIHKVLTKQTDWRLEDGRLVREWKFDSFSEAMKIGRAHV